MNNCCVREIFVAYNARCDSVVLNNAHVTRDSCFIENLFVWLLEIMAKRKGRAPKEEEVIQLGPQVAEGEQVFGVAHIFASFNDTFVHVTDLSGK